MPKNHKVDSISPADPENRIRIRGISLDTATGRVPYPLTNDVMFHIVVQNSKNALIYLLNAVLGFRNGSIADVEVLNPIDYNDSVSAKEIILDVWVRMSNGEFSNIEVQVAPTAYWTSRSLFYAGRKISGQNPGRYYESLQTVHQIGILDFPLFESHTAFHDVYRLRNEDGRVVYTDKIDLHVIDLTHLALAAETDISSGLQQWAQLFKASTWEQIRELVKKNERLKEAAEIMYAATADERTAAKMEAREMNLRDERARFQYAWDEHLKKEAAKLNQIHEEMRHTENRLREAQNDLRETQNDLREAQDDLRETQDDLRETQNNLQETQSSLREATNHLQQARDTAQQAENKAQQAENKAQQAENKAQQAENKAQQAENKAQQAENKAQFERERADQAERHSKELEAEIAELKRRLSLI